MTWRGTWDPFQMTFLWLIHGGDPNHFLTGMTLQVSDGFDWLLTPVMTRIFQAQNAKLWTEILLNLFLELWTFENLWFGVGYWYPTLLPQIYYETFLGKQLDPCHYSYWWDLRTPTNKLRLIDLIVFLYYCCNSSCFCLHPWWITSCHPGASSVFQVTAAVSDSDSYADEVFDEVTFRNVEIGIDVLQRTISRVAPTYHSEENWTTNRCYWENPTGKWKKWNWVLNGPTFLLSLHLQKKYHIVTMWDIPHLSKDERSTTE